MLGRVGLGMAVGLILAVAAAGAWADECTDCHQKVTPSIVSDWQTSKHAKMGVGCTVCHGSDHKSAADAAKATLPTPKTCGMCHPTQLKQFSAGKHAMAWQAMKAMPAAHDQPMMMIEGLQGCGGCHKIGLKTEAEEKDLMQNGGGFGVASCDACHTRHSFSVEEAKQPEACRTCHMGFDHAQWDMYEGSKHGVRYTLKREKVLPADAAAPTCQTCHMPNGDHDVRTAWGFMAVKLPPPKDAQWAADQTTILKALGILSPDGKPTARLAVVKKVDLARVTQASWDAERAKMLKVCSQCHSQSYARNQLEMGDKMVQKSDRLMAEAIDTVAGLYHDKVLPRPKAYSYAFPDLLTFSNAPTVIEQRLFVMFLEHRMRTFQGAFHENPDYAFWNGWAEMKRDVSYIKLLARQMRAMK